jgi:hypothetical protein
MVEYQYKMYQKLDQVQINDVVLVHNQIYYLKKGINKEL